MNSRRLALAVAALGACFLLAPVGRAQEVDGASPAAKAGDDTASASPRRPPPPPPPTSLPSFEEHFVMDAGRAPVTAADPDTLRFQVHGEYQVRLSGLTDVRLLGADDNADSLGQTTRLYHWLRMTPRLQIADKAEVIGQLDVPQGFMLGQETRLVNAAEPAYDDRQPFGVEPRWLYLEWRTAIGQLRLGQQPWHWGSGILANDGDHASLFGDYFGGDKVERILFSAKPAGSASPIHVDAAADLVFEDDTADLIEGDLALQAVLALYYRDQYDNHIGFLGRYRHQRRHTEGSLKSSEGSLDVFDLDSAGRFNAKLPGEAGHVFGAYEVVYRLGRTGLSRSIDPANTERLSVRQLGAVTQLGAVITDGTPDQRWGKLVFAVEWGWASGEADPTDGTSRMFRFDPNHNVGLILFDEVLAWKSARSATIARDPSLSQRGLLRIEALASNGSVFGATYLNPTVVYRPVAELDLKAGLVVAQATADLVDPTRVVLDGRFVNFDGGAASSHDLGVEVDAGVEYRAPLEHGMRLGLGAQGGVLFPGHAFNTANGEALPTQYLGVLRFGFQY